MIFNKKKCLLIISYFVCVLYHQRLIFEIGTKYLCGNFMFDLGLGVREVGLQTDEVRQCMDIMREQGAYGAGMSSFGPTVYAVAEEPGEVEKVVA